MRRSALDVSVGVFLLLGILALAWLSVQLGRVELFGGGGYAATADFPAVGGLKPGATVEIAGVPIGRVERISLADYRARLHLRLRPDVQLSDDSIVSIKTRGLIGEKFVQVNPGGSDRMVAPGGRFTEIEPPVDLEEIISKYVFGGVDSPVPPSGAEQK
ncbi:MAG TPA: outer membrane lipid asymmetry maintenance protein MlaD [Candidatus Binatia bacterium]|jgi:phospholipid/cholesterol/gamma-HCH transport system substrate-binding protein|nr:outer membrane lipid asymmetry maintenance protein MlaD [Candidatus Binatia bacterium]